MFVQFQFCPAAQCRQGPSPLSAGNQGSQVCVPCWGDSCSVAVGSIHLTIVPCCHCILTQCLHAIQQWRGIWPLRVLGPGLRVFSSVEGRECDPKHVALPEVPRHGCV